MKMAMFVRSLRLRHRGLQPATSLRSHFVFILLSLDWSLDQSKVLFHIVKKLATKYKIFNDLHLVAQDSSTIKQTNIW